MATSRHTPGLPLRGEPVAFPRTRVPQCAAIGAIRDAASLVLAIDALGRAGVLPELTRLRRTIAATGYPLLAEGAAA